MPDLYGHLTPQGVLNGSLQTIVYANNYNDLINKPSINSVELQGNKTAADLGLLTEGDIPVESVNGKQGVVILDGDDIEYEAGTSVNSKITDLEAEIGSGPVVSVNGQQGVVELDGTDINYSLTKTLNQKIDEVAASIPIVSYPVTSVNTKTGDVVLDGDDIDYAEGVTVNEQIGTNAANIGDLSQLTTSDKSSLVGAVNEIASYTPVYGNTASGAIATFDTSLALPLQDCTVAINAVQESGTPTPSSPKAISGFTGANIHVADDETPHVIDNVTAITWNNEAGTVYGGSLDVTSGVLTVDRASDIINNFTTNYYSTGSVNYLYGSIANKYSTPINDTEHPLMFEMLEYGGSTYASQFTDLKCYQSTGLYIYLVDNSCSSKSDFITKYGTARLVWYLATPVTYQLTPIQISAIVGTNNVFTDTNGNTSVVYACSLKDYIEGQ